MYHYKLGKRYISVNPFSLCTTDRYLSLQCITNDEQKSATIVTIKLKVSMSSLIATEQNHVFNPYDSSITDVNTTLNTVHVQSCIQ